MTPTDRSSDGGAFLAQFNKEAEKASWGAGDEVVVGVSGGLDSMTLLYLLLFHSQVPAERLHVAHLDHGMRPGSEADAAWLAGVCRAWQVPCHIRAALPPVRTEAGGREARYRLFHDLAAKVGARTIMTAHNANDQAETVLFRIARGAGPAGLAGVRPNWSTGVTRPLLPFWRRDVEAFAEAKGVPYREDPTNRELTWTRNRLRHEVLPLLEDAVPGASNALVALGQMAESEGTAMAELTDVLLETLAHEVGDETHLEVSALVPLSDSVLTQMARRLSVRMGAEPGREATAQVVKFMKGGRSGQQVDVAGGLVVDRSFDVIRFRRPLGADSISDWAAPGSEGPRDVLVSGREGHGRFKVGPRLVEVGWGGRPLEDFPHRTSFTGQELLPLTVRPWQAGDRIRMTYGTKKVKKLLAEKRVPHTDRRALAVVADREGEVVWVPGVVDTPPSGADSGGERLYVGIRYLPEEGLTMAREGS